MLNILIAKVMEPKITFPALYESKKDTGKVILITGYGCNGSGSATGVTLNPGATGFVGEVRNDFVLSCYKPFTGKVTMSNKLED